MDSCLYSSARVPVSPAMLPSDTLSVAFGYASMVCWLGAQLPQLYENIRLQSSDGLSLIFLLNWYLGDFSNLIGCILTHQLPFQRWLATYFVFVDTILVFQYFYYARKPSDLHHERAISVPRQVVHRTERTPSRYRTISAVAANVAAAAALAAQHDELGHPRHHTRRPRRYTGQSFDLTHGGAPVEEELPSKVTDSFYSEDGHATRRSPERYRGRGGSVGRHSLIATHGTSHTVCLNAAEPISNENLTLVEREQTDTMTEIPSGPSTGRRRNSRAGRGSAGLVFLGVWALFSLGGHSTGGENLRLNPIPPKSVGRVLGASTTNVTSTVLIKDHHRGTQLQQHESEINLIFPGERESTQFHFTTASDAEILGRISAWLCTTLYLTCRLPQIWKNYARKSVEGLSMTLFICAFFGNVFYVASIVSSPRFYLPPPLSTEYIRESIPYILGSGGTLMFDVGILSQFFAYRRRHHCSFSDGNPVSEETGLLISTQTHYHAGQHSSRGRTSNIKVTEQ